MIDRVGVRDQRGGAGVRFLLVLAMLVAGFVWLARPPGLPHSGTTPHRATLTAERDPLVRRTTGWTPVRRATVMPGDRTFTGHGQCTANFVFSDAASHVYLGQAAHCAETDEGPDGCRTHSQPLGTPVAITRGESNVGRGRVVAWGRLAYSSWLAMQRRHDADPVRCAYNDFALIRIRGSDRSLVNPTMPFWGGPAGLANHEVTTAQRVYGFGRSELRKAHSVASRQSGMTLPDVPRSRGWSHSYVARSPGIPGDSGSGYLDSGGYAIGTLSTLRVGPVLVNGVGDLRHELRYARTHSGIRGLRLELGTVPFNALG